MTRHVFPMASAAAITVPGLLAFFLNPNLNPPFLALVSGAAILGASFLLLWACDAAQKDVSQALALSVVALIAVLPEYAVDMYFTWQAGQHPGSDYAQYAVANMTGANRLLIGVAWTIITAIFWCRTKRDIKLEEDRKTEILFLGMATLYAFLIPIKGTLAWYDGIVFIGIFIWYISLASRRPCTECDLQGPADLLGRQPKARRRAATAAMFLFSAAVIVTNAKPFSEALVATGKGFGINEFMLVQWLAPIASEAPELIVAIMFALRGHAAVALGSLLSSKLNQWTLLVGMIPWAFGLSSGSFEQPIPMGSFQMNEIMLTAAQSLLAVALLVGMKLGLKGALVLFALFAGQLMAPALTGWDPEEVHLIFARSYLALSVVVLLVRRRELGGILQGARFERKDGRTKPAVAVEPGCPATQANPKSAW